MKKIFGSLRIKALILAVLLGLTFQAGWNVNETEACVECVTLTGGLCVGCATSSSGHSDCTPYQESCSCMVSGTCRTDGPPPAGGPNGE